MTKRIVKPQVHTVAAEQDTPADEALKMTMALTQVIEALKGPSRATLPPAAFWQEAARWFGSSYGRFIAMNDGGKTEARTRDAEEAARLTALYATKLTERYVAWSKNSASETKAEAYSVIITAIGKHRDKVFDALVGGGVGLARAQALLTSFPAYVAENLVSAEAARKVRDRLVAVGADVRVVRVP